MESLSIKRGDSFSAPFKISIDGVYQTMTGGIVFFTIKDTYLTPDDQAIIKKQYVGTGETTLITLTSEETHTLLENTDKQKIYYAEIKYKSATNEIYSEVLTLTVYYTLLQEIV